MREWLRAGLKKLANGPSRPLSTLLLKVSATLSTIPASWRPHHNDLIKGLCEWSSWILSSGVVDFFIVPRLYHLPFHPQQTPYLSYNKPPILTHLCSVRLKKDQEAVSRRSVPAWICQDQLCSFQLRVLLMLLRFWKHFPLSSKMLFPRCFLTSKGRSRVCPSPGASSKNKIWNSLGLKGGLEGCGIC